MVVPVLGTAADTGLIVDQQLVDITVASNGLHVEETTKVTNNGAENCTSIRFWLQQDVQTLQILVVNSGTELTPMVNSFIRDCNFSEKNLTLAPGTSLELRVIYTLPLTTENYETTLLYTTTLFTVTYNKRQLFQGEHLVYTSDTNTFKIRLSQPTEAPLSMMSLIIIFALVVLLFAVLLLSLRSQRSKVKRTALVESEETLVTKKALLLELLKELEKQYRAKSISDETYNKIKEDYKQQAVDVMKKLEDLKK